MGSNRDSNEQQPKTTEEKNRKALQRAICEFYATEENFRGSIKMLVDLFSDEAELKKKGITDLQLNELKLFLAPYQALTPEHNPFSLATTDNDLHKKLLAIGNRGKPGVQSDPEQSLTEVEAEKALTHILNTINTRFLTAGANAEHIAQASANYLAMQGFIQDLLKNNPALANYLSNTTQVKNSGDDAKTFINAQIITPVQRMLRTVLLLKDFEKQSLPDSTQREAIVSTKITVEAFSNDMNDSQNSNALNNALERAIALSHSTSPLASTDKRRSEELFNRAPTSQSSDREKCQFVADVEKFIDGTFNDHEPANTYLKKFLSHYESSQLFPNVNMGTQRAIQSIITPALITYEKKALTAILPNRPAYQERAKLLHGLLTMLNDPSTTLQKKWTKLNAFFEENQATINSHIGVAPNKKNNLQRIQEQLTELFKAFNQPLSPIEAPLPTNVVSSDAIPPEPTRKAPKRQSPSTSPSPSSSASDHEDNDPRAASPYAPLPETAFKSEGEDGETYHVTKMGVARVDDQDANMLLNPPSPVGTLDSTSLIAATLSAHPQASQATPTTPPPL